MKEKSYIAYMQEISPDELYEGLLAHGMFTDKLPPVFTSEPFYQYCQQQKNPFNGDSHQYIYYESMRNINVPRTIAIPNPFAYQLQCETIKTHWKKIQAHFSDKTSSNSYKVSRIHLRKMHDTPMLFQMNYENWRTDGDPVTNLSMGKRYMVKADISQCFPSVYTHALPWALVGKETAKKTRNNPKEWYNAIDIKTRKTTHDETHGLLIGPHISNLLSEIILTSVDYELKDWSDIRAIDDYTCYVDTYENGQRFLTCLNAALREYDLSLNHKKTSISSLPLAVTEHWQRKLNSIQLLTSYGQTDYIRARSYLDYAIELMHENGENAAILNYAIKTLLGTDKKGNARVLTTNAREYVAKTVMSLAELYPYLISLLDKYVFSICCKGCLNNYQCIKEYSDRMYEKGIAIHNFEQSSYALLFAIKYGFNIDRFDCSEIIKTEDCILLLMAFLYSKAKSNKNAITELKNHARAIKDDPESFDRYWVFLYEILPMSDLKSEWKKLKKSNISFIKDIGTP